MAIDKSGKWWVGEQATDLREYLDAYSEESYRVDEFRLSSCACGSPEFILDASDNDGVARRTCAKCNYQHFICDSEQFWDDAEPDRWRCIECSSDKCNVGVGFSLYEDKDDIKWIYI